MRWTILLLAAASVTGCGRKDEPGRPPTVAVEAGSAPAADAARPDFPDVEPTSSPPEPTVKPGKGDCKVEYAPKPTRDPNPMCKVPALKFRMGTDDPDKKRRKDKPAFEVELSSYYIDQFEVTTDQIAHYLNTVKDNTCPGAINGCFCAKGCVPGDVELVDGRYVVVPGRTREPALHVSYEGARRYCAWAGKQLPTEAQWEASARFDPKTSGTNDYPWGAQDDPGRYADSADVQPVGTFDGTAKPDGSSALGVHDLAGNASERMAGCWSSYPLCTSPPCRDPAPASSEGCSGIQRSGTHIFARSTTRSVYGYTARDGFRCARPAP
ncbi:MAG TPA: SUMF1/EgtB/PvdO family nonheme iron enzyme [Kofleriaceae bacterium]|nr:SUMF1/EgtB/PvdO family nonheme iron enzyme [Kofleriaceae bacterium]